MVKVFHCISHATTGYTLLDDLLPPLLLQPWHFLPDCLSAVEVPTATRECLLTKSLIYGHAAGGSNATDYRIVVSFHVHVFHYRTVKEISTNRLQYNRTNSSFSPSGSSVASVVITKQQRGLLTVSKEPWSRANIVHLKTKIHLLHSWAGN
jgi:hypothetical protein